MVPYIAFFAEGLTAGEILKGIPHDGPAFVIYALLAVCGVIIWRGSRNRGGRSLPR